MRGERFELGRKWILEVATGLAADCSLTARWRTPQGPGPEGAAGAEADAAAVLEFLKQDERKGELRFDREAEIEACATPGETMTSVREQIEVRIYRELSRVSPWDDPRTGAH